MSWRLGGREGQCGKERVRMGGGKSEERWAVYGENVVVEGEGENCNVVDVYIHGVGGVEGIGK